MIIRASQEINSGINGFNVLAVRTSLLVVNWTFTPGKMDVHVHAYSLIIAAYTFLFAC